MEKRLPFAALLGTLARGMQVGGHFLGDQAPVLNTVILVEFLEQSVLILLPDFLLN